MDSIPSLLGLALRAGRLAVGEEPVGTACRDHKGYLLLLASDAADNTIRRALSFCQAGNTISLQLPLTKAELGSRCGPVLLRHAGHHRRGLCRGGGKKAGSGRPSGLWSGLGDPLPKGRRAKSAGMKSTPPIKTRESTNKERTPPKGRELPLTAFMSNRRRPGRGGEKRANTWLGWVPYPAMTEVALFEF